MRERKQVSEDRVPNDLKIHETKMLFWMALLDKAETLTLFQVTETPDDRFMAAVELTYREGAMGYAYEGSVSVMDVDLDGEKKFVVTPITSRCLVDDTCSDARSDVLQAEVLDKVAMDALALTARTFARGMN